MFMPALQQVEASASRLEGDDDGFGEGEWQARSQKHNVCSQSRREKSFEEEIVLSSDSDSVGVRSKAFGVGKADNVGGVG